MRGELKGGFKAPDPPPGPGGRASWAHPFPVAGHCAVQARVVTVIIITWCEPRGLPIWLPIWPCI